MLEVGANQEAPRKGPRPETKHSQSKERPSVRVPKDGLARFRVEQAWQDAFTRVIDTESQLILRAHEPGKVLAYIAENKLTPEETHYLKIKAERDKLATQPKQDADESVMVTKSEAEAYQRYKHVQDYIAALNEIDIDSTDPRVDEALRLTGGKDIPSLKAYLEKNQDTLPIGLKNLLSASLKVKQSATPQPAEAATPVTDEKPVSEQSIPDDGKEASSDETPRVDEDEKQTHFRKLLSEVLSSNDPRVDRVLTLTMEPNIPAIKEYLDKHQTTLPSELRELLFASLRIKESYAGNTASETVPKVAPKREAPKRKAEQPEKTVTASKFQVDRFQASMAFRDALDRLDHQDTHNSTQVIEKSLSRDPEEILQFISEKGTSLTPEEEHFLHVVADKRRVEMTDPDTAPNAYEAVTLTGKQAELFTAYQQVTNLIREAKTCTDPRRDEVIYRDDPEIIKTYLQYNPDLPQVLRELLHQKLRMIELRTT